MTDGDAAKRKEKEIYDLKGVDLRDAADIINFNKKKVNQGQLSEKNLLEGAKVPQEAQGTMSKISGMFGFSSRKKNVQTPLMKLSDVVTNEEDKMKITNNPSQININHLTNSAKLKNEIDNTCKEEKNKDSGSYSLFSFRGFRRKQSNPEEIMRNKPQNSHKSLVGGNKMVYNKSLIHNQLTNEANQLINAYSMNKKQAEKFNAQEKNRTKAKQSLTDGIFRKKKTNAS